MEKAEADEKEFKKNQATRKTCGSSVCSCHVQPSGVPVQNAPKPFVIPLDSQSVLAELDKAKQLVDELTSGIEVVRNGVLSKQPEVKGIAVSVRDETLKNLVAAMVRATLAIEHMW